VRVIDAPDLGDSEMTRRALDQANPKPLLEQRDAAAQLRLRYPSARPAGAKP
jgi:hypothetical protein